MCYLVILLIWGCELIDIEQVVEMWIVHQWLVDVGKDIHEIQVRIHQHFV